MMIITITMAASGAFLYGGLRHVGLDHDPAAAFGLAVYFFGLAIVWTIVYSLNKS